MTAGIGGRIVIDMEYVIGTAAPTVAGDAFVRGQNKRFALSLSEYRGSWAVVAFAARHADVLELAKLEEAFGADGAIVLAATPADYHETADRYGDEPIRFPLLTEVTEHRRVTMIVDPGGVIRHVGLRRSARETLAALEELLVAPQLRVAA
jgi:alkyl hydroperoxide reductase subunit AhpC